MPEAGLFSAAELVDMAIQLEQNGQAFYLQASLRASQPEVKRLLEHLAQQEQHHEQMFRKLQPTEREHRPGQEYPGQKSAYIQALLEERLLPSDQVVNQVLPDFALGMEKDSLLFYYEMRHLLGDDAKPIVKEIITEEKKHVETLRGLCHLCRT
jgi:rubrerythrin